MIADEAMGVVAGARGHADTGLGSDDLPPGKNFVIATAGDCSGVGRGRRRGRNGSSNEADRRLELYLRASLLDSARLGWMWLSTVIWILTNYEGLFELPESGACALLPAP